MTTTAACPHCGAGAELPTGALQGELIACTSCGRELEVVHIEPVILEQA